MSRWRTHTGRVAELARQTHRLDRQIARLEGLSRRMGWVRLALVLGTAALATALYAAGAGTPTLAVLAAGVVAFGFVARRHARLEAGLTRHRWARQLRRAAQARLERDWPRLPPPLDAPADASHPFAADLNLLGPRSLHHLLDDAASAGGSAVLRAWLTDPAPALDAARRRQAQVEALRRRPHFRLHLALAGRAATAPRPAPRWHDADLLRWLGRTAERIPALGPWLAGLTALALLNGVLALGHFAGALPLLWPYTLALYFVLYFPRLRANKAVFDEAHDVAALLARVRPPLVFLEAYPLRDAGLEAVRAPLRTARPSHLLRRLGRIATLASWTKSELLWLVFNGLVPWDLWATFALHRAGSHLRTHLPAWLEAWYTFEALAGLAAFAYTHPHYATPTLLDEARPPVLEARALGHPLLPEPVKVRNDFALEHLGELALVTGSNMSGKSTFLRAVGVNLALAAAGGVVDAAALRAPLFRLYTCLNVSDSVQDGLSYFYAEVRRLKALLDALQAPEARPLCFLIDEIFRGTNNRERLLGSQAYVRALAGGHGLGLISTHDLELVHLADTLPGVHNYHFREDVAGTRMTFDYTLRPGPSPTTNALKIMQREGLPVPLPETEGP